MKKFTNKYFFLILGLLFLICLIPRSVEVINGNPVFGFDQGRDYLEVKEIFDNKHLRLIGAPIGAGAAGFQGIFHGPFYFYFLGISYLLFKGDPNGGTVLMFIFGALSLGMSFVLGRKMLNKFGGLILMVLLGISPLFIAQSRFVWNSYPSTIFILLAFYFIFRIKDSGKNVFLASFFSAFIYNFELGIAIPICVCLLLYSVYLFRIKFKNYLIMFSGFFIGLLPMFLFEMRHKFQGFLGMIDYITKSGAVDRNIQNKYLIEHLNSFVYNFKDTFPILPSNLIFYLGVILFLSFIFLLKSEKDKKLKSFLLFLAFLVPINYFILSFLKNGVYNYYLYHISIIYLIIFSYSLIKSFKNKLLFSVLFISLIIVIFFASIKNFNMVIYDMNDYGGTAKLKGKIDAIDYIYKDAKGKKFGLLVFSPPIYTYPYTYIIEWYGKKKYNFVPSESKNGLFYLLIEPDSAQIWTYNGWLETVIKSGKILNTTKLPSGFIVQKRIGDI